MSEYRCENPGRRQALREQTAPVGSRINAIDYLVVSDDGDVTASLRQRVLRVHFEFADHVATLQADQVFIVGGVRVENPRVSYVLPMSEVNAPGGPGVDPTFDPELDAADRAWFNDLAANTADPEAWLVVVLESYGDFSTYSLELRAVPGAEDPPLGFDRRLSEVEFSFKVECPTPFDCAQETECPTTIEVEPDLDYLARDFNSFRRLMSDRLALTQPGEPSANIVGLRGAIVDVLAYAADHISYEQDAVATETYLSTARRRSSVRRHARLLDYPMHEGCNARAFVHLRVDVGASFVDQDLIAQGARFLTRGPRFGPVIPLAEQADALSREGAVFEALHDVRTLVDAHNEIAFHTWGDTDCCLLEGAISATLADPQSRLSLVAGDFLLLEEVRSARTGREADADPARRHIVRLLEVSAPYQDDLLGTQVVDVGWGVEDALPFSLPVSTSDDALSVARGNMLLVDHGRSFDTREDEPIPLREWGRVGEVRATLPRKGVSWSEPYLVPVGQPGPSAAASVQQDPRRATPLVVLEAEGELWFPQRDLLASDPGAAEFVVEPENDGTIGLRFGNDETGRRPGFPLDFEASYRIGNGAEGNVGAEAIAHLLAEPQFVSGTAVAIVSAVRNPMPAVGGLAPESTTEVKLYAPHAFRVQQRAVTARDWVEVAGRHPDVQRAVAKIVWTGSWHTVFVTVDRRDGRAVEGGYVDELLEFLEPFRLAGYDLEVRGPKFVPLDLELSVCVQSDHFVDVVLRRLIAEFSAGRLSSGALGFFHPDNFTFGQTVYLSQIIARAAAVAGVERVDAIRFKRWGEPERSELADARLPIGPVEVARCDNDRNLPDNGQIRFTMGGGL